MPHEAAWICEVCHAPITAGSATGTINILHRALSKRAALSDDDDLEVIGDDEIEEASELASRQVEAATRLLEPPTVEFHVYHLDHCAPPEQMGDYNIACSRVLTIDAWIAWMIHMGEKNWMTKGDILRMAGFWYSGHDRPIPRELN